jgi:hypothetical protein
MRPAVHITGRRSAGEDPVVARAASASWQRWAIASSASCCSAHAPEAGRDHTAGFEHSNSGSRQKDYGDENLTEAGEAA